MRHSTLKEVFGDEELWKRHAAVVIETILPTTKSPTYWDRTLFFV
ncbi:MAG TPA: hypothetical protein VNT79_04315 [Phycisphaerae bacterium]|nr:hypothetical protein [Phycisphaerae bacterium]